MKKVIKIENLDCARCADKLQRELSRIDGVESISVNFLTQKITLQTDETKIDVVLKEITNIVAKREPQCVLKDI